MPPKRGRKKLTTKTPSVEKLAVKRNCNGEPVLAKAGPDAEHVEVTPMLRRGRSRKSAPFEHTPEDEMKVGTNKGTSRPAPSSTRTTPTTRSRKRNCTANEINCTGGITEQDSSKEGKVQIQEVHRSQNLGSAESCASAGSSQPSHLTKETIIVGSHPGNELKDLQFTAAQHGITHSIVKLETLDLDKKRTTKKCIPAKQISANSSTSREPGVTPKALQPQVEQYCSHYDEKGSEHPKEVKHENCTHAGSIGTERSEDLCGKDYLEDIAGEEDFEPDYDEDLHIHDNSVLDCTMEQNSTESDYAEAELEDSTTLVGDSSEKGNVENVSSELFTVSDDVINELVQNDADEQILPSDHQTISRKQFPRESDEKSVNVSEQQTGETGSTVISNVKCTTWKEKDDIQHPRIPNDVRSESNQLRKETLHEKEEVCNVGDSYMPVSSPVESSLIENRSSICKKSRNLSTEKHCLKGNAAAKISQDLEGISGAKSERTCTVKMPAWYDKVVSESNIWNKDKRHDAASGVSHGQGNGCEGGKESCTRKSTSVLKNESTVKPLGVNTSKTKLVRSVKPLMEVEVKPKKEFTAATIFDTEDLSSVDSVPSDSLSDSVNTQRKKAVVKALSRKIAAGNTSLDGQKMQGPANKKIKCDTNRQMSNNSVNSSSNNNKIEDLHSKKHGVGRHEANSDNTGMITSSAKETCKTNDVSRKVKCKEDSGNSLSVPKDTNSCESDVFDVGFDIELETSIDMLKDDDRSCVENSQFWRVHRGTNTGHVPYEPEVMCERIKNSASCPISMSFRTIAIQTCKPDQHEHASQGYLPETIGGKLSSSLLVNIQNLSKDEACTSTSQTVRRPWKRQHDGREQGSLNKQKRIVLKRATVLPSADRCNAEVGKKNSLSSDEAQMQFTCGNVNDMDDGDRQVTEEANKSSSDDNTDGIRGQRSEQYIRRQHASNTSAVMVTSSGNGSGGNDSQLRSENNKTVHADEVAEGFMGNPAPLRGRLKGAEGLMKDLAQSKGNMASDEESQQHCDSFVGGSTQKLTKSKSNIRRTEIPNLVRSFPGVDYRHSGNESATMQYSGKDCKAGSRKEYLRKQPMPRGMIQKYDILQPSELDCEQNGILPESRNAIEKCGREGKWEKLAGMLSQLVSLNEKQEIQRCLQHFTSALMNGPKYEMNFIKFLQALESKRNGALKNDEKQFIGTIGLMLMTRCLAQKNIQTAFMVLLLLHDKAIPYMYPSLPFIVPTAKVILTATEICLAVSKPEQIYEIMKMAHWFEKCNLETMIHIRVDAIRDLLLRLLRAVKSSQLTIDCCSTVLSVIAACVKKLAMKYKTDFNVLFRELLPLAKEHQQKSLYRAIIKTVAMLHSINLHPAEVRELFHFVYSAGRSEPEFYDDALVAMKYGQSLAIYPDTKYSIRTGGLVVLWMVMSREEMHAAVDLYLDSMCVTWLNLGAAKTRTGLQLSVQLSEVHATSNIRQAYSHEMGLNIERKDAIDKAMSVFKQDLNPPLEWTEYSDGIFQISPTSLFDILQVKLEQRRKKESLKAMPEGFRVLGKQKTVKNFMKRQQEILSELWQSVNIGSNGDLELSVGKPSILQQSSSAQFTATDHAQLQSECNKNRNNELTFGRSGIQNLTDSHGESLSARMKDIFHSMSISKKRGEAGITGHIGQDSVDNIPEEKPDCIPQRPPLLPDSMIPEFETYSGSDLCYDNTDCYQGSDADDLCSDVRQKSDRQLINDRYAIVGGCSAPHEQFSQCVDKYYSPNFECLHPVASTSNRPLLESPINQIEQSNHYDYNQSSSFEGTSVDHWSTAEVAHRQPLLPDPCVQDAWQSSGDIDQPIRSHRLPPPEDCQTVTRPRPLLEVPCTNSSYGRMTLQPSMNMRGASGQRRFRPFQRSRQR